VKVIDPGHEYELDWLDGKPPIERSGGIEDGNRLIFVKRAGAGYPGNKGSHPGTNMQEVLRALIDRVKYLDGQIHDERNLGVLENLRGALWLLEDRAAERHGRSLQSQVRNIEHQLTCQRCGHVECQGKCHA
jgi:hypothetical protein